MELVTGPITKMEIKLEQVKVKMKNQVRSFLKVKDMFLKKRMCLTLEVAKEAVGLLF